MILYCDEDVGSKVPKALKIVGLRVVSAVSKRATSEPDIQWLERAGKKGWLAFSCNKDILNVPEEKDAIIKNNVGIIFLTSGNLHPKDKLFLILRKWEWFEMIHNTLNRPFAFFLSPSGQIRKLV